MKRGVMSGLVVFFCGLDGLIPGRTVSGRFRERGKGRQENCSRGERLDDLDGRRDSLLATFLDHVVPLFAGRIGEHLTVTGV